MGGPNIFKKMLAKSSANNMLGAKNLELAKHFRLIKKLGQGGYSTVYVHGQWFWGSVLTTVPASGPALEPVGLPPPFTASPALPPLPQRRYEVERLSDRGHYALKVTNIQELKPSVAHEVVQEIRRVRTVVGEGGCWLVVARQARRACFALSAYSSTLPPSGDPHPTHLPRQAAGIPAAPSPGAVP